MSETSTTPEILDLSKETLLNLFDLSMCIYPLVLHDLNSPMDLLGTILAGLDSQLPLSLASEGSEGMVKRIHNRLEIFSQARSKLSAQALAIPSDSRIRASRTRWLAFHHRARADRPLPQRDS